VFGQAYQFTRDDTGDGSTPADFENLLRTASAIMPTGTNPVTISVWFRQTANSGQNKLFGYGSSNLDNDATTGEAMDLSLEGGGIRLRNYNGNITYGSGYDFLGADSGWHHLAVRVDSGATTFHDVTLFLDGAPLGVSLDNTALADTLNIASSPLGVGNVGYDATLQNGFTGLLDEMRIYDTALSDAEIQALAVAPPAPPVATINAFSFFPQTRLSPGSPFALTWSVTNADVAALQPGNVDVLALTTNGSGSLVVYPSTTTIYTLSVSNNNGSYDQASVTTSVGTNQLPNIIFFLLDDFGWADWRQNGAIHGSVFYETPRMDQLAAEGKWFRHGYAACTVCSPTRASILSGQIPAFNKVTQWISGTSDSGKALREGEWTKRMALSEVTIAEVLHGAGYRTIHVGKWHLGQAGDAEANPLNQGFDVNIGGNQAGSPPSPERYFASANGFSQLPNLPAAVATNGAYLTDVLTEQACQQIKSCAASNSPFFLYLAHYAVHVPLQAPADTVAKYQAKLNNHPGMDWLGQSNPTYAAMIEHVDRSLGAILDLLQDPDGNPSTEDSIATNTLIVFTSDNGGLASSTSNRPLRKGKGGEYEGGVREPVVFWWPGRIAPGTLSDAPVISYDYYPTFLSVAQVPGDPAQVLHGQDLSPLVFDSGPFERTNGLVFHYPHYSDQGGKPYSALRKGHFKSVYLYESEQFELYNVVEDPGEATNLASTLPDLHAVLSHELARRLLGLDANYPRNATTLVPLPPTALVSTNDTDGDGLTDLEEVIVGTVVNDPGSVFREDISTVVPMTVSVAGKARRRYQLEATERMTPPHWTKVQVSDALTIDQAVMLPDTNAPASPGSRFYRVGVSLDYESPNPGFSPSP
jgi:arylsulfatase A-like enzyme